MESGENELLEGVVDSEKKARRRRTINQTERVLQLLEGKTILHEENANP